MGSTPVTFFRTNPKDTHLATIVIRGATPNILDDVERAIDDGVNVYKVASPLPSPDLCCGDTSVKFAY